MRFLAKKILGLRVETQTKKYLGQIFNFVVDVENQSIISYEVKKSFSKKELIISSSQIISFEKDKMIVKDNVVDLLVQTKIASMKKNEALTPTL